MSPVWKKEYQDPKNLNKRRFSVCMRLSLNVENILYKNGVYIILNKFNIHILQTVTAWHDHSVLYLFYGFNLKFLYLKQVKQADCHNQYRRHVQHFAARRAERIPRYITVHVYQKIRNVAVGKPAGLLVAGGALDTGREHRLRVHGVLSRSVQEALIHGVVLRPQIQDSVLTTLI